jgi:hypothetical protein
MHLFRKAIVVAALVACGLLGAPQAASASPAADAPPAATSATGDIGTQSLNCKNFLTRTYYSVSCQRNTALPDTYYAWVDCWDVSAGLAYWVPGPVRAAPLWPFYGADSTAACDSGTGDYVIDHGIGV